MSAAGSSIPNGANDIDYVRKPSFVKFFSGPQNAERLQLPREWIHRHGDELPHFCKLVMPTGGEWRVLLLNLASDCHFCDGWSDFVHDNRIRHSDFITFTLVRGEVFNVKRYDFGNGCPPRDEYEPDVGEYSDVVLSPDIDSEDDYPPSENGSDGDSSEDYIAYRSVPRADEYPSFDVVLNKSNIERTLEIPMSFWRAHLRMSAWENYVYFMVEEKTWLVELQCVNERIWVKHG
ncbi:hypothetical protein AAHA92_04667 [Salvia divinorum]|uniref:TF-B3 domain-containing protein n=1 Tax=Salvia divinorum TaxID=28513 RepID=A0ABD1I368_SALDI